MFTIGSMYSACERAQSALIPLQWFRCCGAVATVVDTLPVPMSSSAFPEEPPKSPTLRAGTPEQLATLLKMAMGKGKMELLTKILPTTCVFSSCWARCLNIVCIRGRGLYPQAEENVSGSFWLLNKSKRDEWDARAEAYRVKRREAWANGLAPITADSEWVDVVLDAIFNRRLLL
ncbi:hypothetical protein C8F04DRAFT_1183810 [Mycena alexandri]|uniref:Uncharacterized protein n=1 Tax=Mycena alexandri TaxID=1745969 RepID=A0AAD6SW83_9AGAR|nr:hypothetical protein C8F04DRAFT_1183810 [Mycena alexandri]